MWYEIIQNDNIVFIIKKHKAKYCKRYQEWFFKVKLNNRTVSNPALKQNWLYCDTSCYYASKTKQNVEYLSSCFESEYFSKLKATQSTISVMSKGSSLGTSCTLI